MCISWYVLRKCLFVLTKEFNDAGVRQFPSLILAILVLATWTSLNSPHATWTSLNPSLF